MNELTLDALKKMKPGRFVSGLAIDSPRDINMTGSGKVLRWVAVRGEYHDWAIYTHWESKTEVQIMQYGDKVGNESNIRKLVPCTDEAFKMYRY